MVKPDSISGPARTHLQLSVAADAEPKPGSRADQLAHRLEQRLSARLQQIRTRLDPQGVSPNTEQTGLRLDILA